MGGQFRFSCPVTPLWRLGRPAAYYSGDAAAGQDDRDCGFWAYRAGGGGESAGFRV